MQLGPTARLLSGVAAVFLFATGAEEWSAQSSGSPSWGGETSFAALDLRAHGKLKVGLGIGFLALTAAGITPSTKKEDSSNEG